MKMYILSLAFVVAALSFSAKAEAALTGDTINWQYYFGGEAFNSGGSPGSFLAGSTTSTFSGDSSPASPIFTISANDSQIIFDFLDTGDWLPSPVSYDVEGLFIRNGILLTDDANPFANVTIDASTNMAGFSISNVTFNSSQLAINWAGLLYTPDTNVVLNVSSAVPEPSSLLLLASGLVGLVVWRRKKSA